MLDKSAYAYRHPVEILGFVAYLTGKCMDTLAVDTGTLVVNTDKQSSRAQLQ